MRYIYMLPAAFLAPVIHEFIKAVCSSLQGDPTPRNTGRLTLNPFKYFDPIGFIFVLHFGFGWGNPTPTAALHYRNRQRGVLVTYLVPVLVNLLLGIGAVAVVAIMTSVTDLRMDGYLAFWAYISTSIFTTDIYILTMIILSHFAFINICMAFFNLIPVFPLAANKILLQFSRPDTIARLNHYEKPMQIILILLLAFGIITQVFTPLAMHIVRLVWGVAV